MLALRGGAARQLVSLLSGPRSIAKAATALDASVSGQHMSTGPKTATPPPNAARGATADLCDIYITDPVDVVTQRKVQIMDPIFRSASCPALNHCGNRVKSMDNMSHQSCVAGTDFGARHVCVMKPRPQDQLELFAAARPCP